MQNKITISLGERTVETIIFINDLPVFGILDVKMHINANDIMPVLHIVMQAPNDNINEELKISLINNINLLKSIPYVELKLQE